MLDPRSYPVDPYILCYKLEMAVLGTWEHQFIISYVPTLCMRYFVCENERFFNIKKYFASLSYLHIFFCLWVLCFFTLL